MAIVTSSEEPTAPPSPELFAAMNFRSSHNHVPSMPLLGQPMQVRSGAQSSSGMGGCVGGCMGTMGTGLENVFPGNGVNQGRLGNSVETCSAGVLAGMVRASF